MRKYSIAIRIILVWKYLKLKLFFVYGYWFYILCLYLDQPRKEMRSGKSIHYFNKQFKEVYSVLCKSKEALMYDGGCCNIRWRISQKKGAITGILYTVASTLWLCEKAGINAEFLTSRDEVKTLFDIPKPASLSWKIVSMYCPRPMGRSIPSKIAYKLSEKLPVRKELRNEADEWFNKHIRGDWVAVHYRGTDAVGTRRYKIELEPYVTYLKAVLDNKSNIFVCSDQAQFIDKMQVAFPERVLARDIQRSSGREPTHQLRGYGGVQQQKDALIDMLILAKANLIYTTGSAFADTVRFFNPKTKIVSLGGRKRGGCYIPIPQKDVFDKLKIK